MKKNILWIVLVCLATLILSCEHVKDDPADYYPRVKTLQANYQGYGIIEVAGIIEDDGSTPVETFGFCLSDSAVPELMDNQLMAGYFQNDTFAAVYQGDWPAGKYYLRAWAVNEDSYSYGNVVSFEVVKTPVICPCNPVPNTIDIFGSGYAKTITSTEVQNDFDVLSPWDFSATAYPGGIDLTFGARPTTGIYMVTGNSDIAYNEVRVNVRTGNGGIGLMDGSLVYVNEYEHNSWTVTICEAQWSSSDYNFLTVNFSCTYNY